MLISFGGCITYPCTDSEAETLVSIAVFLWQDCRGALTKQDALALPQPELLLEMSGGKGRLSEVSLLQQGHPDVIQIRCNALHAGRQCRPPCLEPFYICSSVNRNLFVAFPT